MRILYHTSLSPACRKVRVALREKELTFDLISENPWEPQHEHFISINPAGELPVLVDEDGLVIRGAAAVSEYLEEIYPARPLLGLSVPERAEVRRLNDWFEGRFAHEVSTPLLFEKIHRKFFRLGEPDSRSIRLAKESLRFHLDYLGNLLTAWPWLAGEAMTLADLAAAAHLSTLDYVGDVPWETYPRVREWYALIKSRPSFRPILAERVAAFRPPAHYDNPDF